MDAFKNLVKQLVVDQGCSQAALHGVIHEVLEEESMLQPKVRVALCLSYGGYEYSESFSRFLAGRVLEHERVAVVPLLKEYGAKISNVYPRLHRILQVHKFRQLGTGFARRDFFDTELVALMNASCDFKHPEELEDAKLPRYHRGGWKLSEDGMPLEFNQAIDKYGANSWKIWDCQKHYSAKAMRFLADYLEVFDDGDDIDDAHEALGVLFASTPYCTLGIRDVPRLLSWRILDYDGKESIETK